MVECFGCHDFGHFRRDCPHRKRGFNNNQRNEQNEPKLTKQSTGGGPQHQDQKTKEASSEGYKQWSAPCVVSRCFACKHCGRKFAHSSNMRRHRRTSCKVLHQEKPFPCTRGCDFHFYRKYTRDCHVRGCEHTTLFVGGVGMMENELGVDGGQSNSHGACNRLEQP